MRMIEKVRPDSLSMELKQGKGDVHRRECSRLVQNRSAREPKLDRTGLRFAWFLV